MKNTTLWCIVALLCMLAVVARADDTKTPALYVGPFVGYHTVPGFLLSFEADTYPKGGLKGHAEGVRFGYNFDDAYSLGGVLFHSDVSGSGPWGQRGKAESYGVTGTARGTVDMDVLGIGIEGTRRFHIWDGFGLVTRLGLGVGYVDVNFDGAFDGHVIDYPDHKIHEPAHEHRNRIIPLLGLGASLEWRPLRNLVVSAGPHWNTGFGAEASISYLFDF